MSRYDLTCREREVLQWFARGKSAGETALLIGISSSTVMFHYRQVAGRYETLNRTHTVCEAIRRRTLVLDLATRDEIWTV